MLFQTVRVQHCPGKVSFSAAEKKSSLGSMPPANLMASLSSPHLHDVIHYARGDILAYREVHRRHTKEEA